MQCDLRGICMANSSVRHHLAAVWFADIAGYSERASEDERGGLQLVELLQALSRTMVERHEGRIVKFFGDAVLAEFSSTEMAVRAAAALCQQYSEQSERTGHSHDLRVGVHVGEVAVGVDGDLYGDCVNAAARIEAAIHPGQVVISEDVWRQIRGREGFRFEALGNREFKGVGLMDVYAVTVEEPPPTAAPSGEGENVQTRERQEQKIRSIAVLPFADLSAEADQEHFSDGVAEEILNALSKIEGLHVPARTSCFAFREAKLDARDIGKRLGVEALLDGSIRRVGKRVRITVELVDVSTGYQLWSHRFDREIEDIFAIQDEIARSVLESLGLELTEREEFRFLKPSTTNVEAYEAYLRGRKLYHKWTRQSVEFARQMFERAVKIDPDFAAAWAGLANTYVDLFRWGRNPENLEAAQRASQRVMFEYGEIEKAANLFEKAHEVRPDEYESGPLRAQALTELGRYDEARRANELAIEWIEKHLEVNPDEPRPYSLGASVLVRLGEAERSKIWTQQAMTLAPNDPLVLYNAACNWALLGESDRALEELERALEAGVAVGDWIKHDPDIESLRGDPRFQAIVKRIAPP